MNLLRSDPYLEVSSGIENRKDGRYLRVVWVSARPDWGAMPTEYVIMRAIAPIERPDDVVCMLDTSVFCWS